MSSSTVTKSKCIICTKSAGIFTCRGCTKDFCARHVMEHRQTLEKDMDEIVLEHDQLRQKLNEYIADPATHPLMAKVDEWERISIDKIRQAAHDARQQLSNGIRRVSLITHVLESMSQELRQARETDDYVEIDLKGWMEKLNTLKKNAVEPDTIQVLHDDSANFFISKITINDRTTADIFERSAGTIRIEDNGQVIVHTQTGNHGSVRGRGVYSVGQHRILFKFEEFQPTNWAFFGIISKTAPMQDSSWNTLKVYGWTTKWSVTRNGSQSGGAIATAHPINTDDIFELLLDCDKRTIRLTHLRTDATHELDVSIAECPFPWQILLGLYTSINDRIRIL